LGDLIKLFQLFRITCRCWTCSPTCRGMALLYRTRAHKAGVEEARKRPSFNTTRSCAGYREPMLPTHVQGFCVPHVALQRQQLLRVQRLIVGNAQQLDWSKGSGKHQQLHTPARCRMMNITELKRQYLCCIMLQTPPLHSPTDTTSGAAAG